MSSITNPNPQLNEMNDLLSFLYDKQISHIINPYEGWNYISKLMYLYILSKHKNDCIIVSKNSAIDLIIYLDLDTKSVTKLDYPATNSIEYFSKINDCLLSGLKLVALPLAIRFTKDNKLTDAGHHNMIIFNLITKEAYRFEPHGYQYMLDDLYNSIDEQLKNDFENIGNFKYNSAKVVCPRKGFQVIESQIPYELDEQGYCGAWSYFFLDLVFTYPNMDITNITNKALEILKDDPYIIRNFIRSYVKFVHVEINTIIEKVFDINDPYDNPTKIKKILDDIHMNKWGIGLTRLYTDKIVNYINKKLIDQAHKPKLLLEKINSKIDIKSFKPSIRLQKESVAIPSMFDMKSFKPAKELLKETSMFDMKSFKPAKELLKETSMFDIKSFKPAKELLKGGKRKSKRMRKKEGK
jgi:hypothetical protein